MNPLTGETIAASVGAFIGAAAAFSLQMVRERQLKADKEYAAIILGQHGLLFIQKTLEAIKQQHLDTQPPSADRYLTLTEFYMPEKYMALDLPSLTFLFRPKMREIVANCFYAEHSFLNALDALKSRNALWTIIKGRPGAVSDVDRDTGKAELRLTNEEVRLLKTSTDQLDRSVEIAFYHCNAAFADLRRCAKIVYPKSDFLKEGITTKPVPPAGSQ